MGSPGTSREFGCSFGGDVGVVVFRCLDKVPQEDLPGHLMWSWSLGLFPGPAYSAAPTNYVLSLQCSSKGAAKFHTRLVSV